MSERPSRPRHSPAPGPERAGGGSGVPLGDPSLCDHKDCSDAARYQVGFTAYAIGHGAHDSAPLRAKIGLYLCEQHKDEALPQDIITDEGWKQITASITEIGRVAPSRASLALTFTPIGSLV